MKITTDFLLKLSLICLLYSFSLQDGTAQIYSVSHYKQSFIDSIPLLINDISVLGNVTIGSSNPDLEDSCDIYDISPLLGVQEILGALTIQGCPFIKSLHGLDSLRSVGGSLSVFGDSIESLRPFSNLESVDGDKFWTGFLNLKSIDGGFQKITNLGHAWVWINGIGTVKKFDALKNVKRIRSFDFLNSRAEEVDFGALEYIHIGMKLSHFVGIKNMTGFSNLDTAGSLMFWDVGDADHLFSFKGLENISFSGSARIWNCAGLTDVSTLKTWTVEDGDFYNIQLIDCPLVEGTLSMPSLKTMRHDIFIDKNPKLQGIDFPNFEEGVIVHISENASLDSVYMPKLKSCTDSFMIRGPSLIRQIGLRDFEETTYLEFSALPKLKSLKGLENLKNIWEYFYLGSWAFNSGQYLKMDSLTALCRMDQFKSHRVTDYEGGLIFEKLPNLRSFDGLDSLRTAYALTFSEVNDDADVRAFYNLDSLVCKRIEGNETFYSKGYISLRDSLNMNYDFISKIDTIWENSSLRVINTAYDSISIPNVHVGMKASMSNNAQLRYFSFPDLVQMGNSDERGSFGARNNPELTDLSYLNHLRSLYGSFFSFSLNPKLNECDFICHLTENLGVDTADITLDLNGSLCSNHQVVFDSLCADWVSTENLPYAEEGSETPFLLFPNPTSGDFSLLAKTDKISDAIGFQLFDLVGRIVYEQKNVSIEAIHHIPNTLPDGTYFYRLLSEGKWTVQSGRLGLIK